MRLQLKLRLCRLQVVAHLGTHTVLLVHLRMFPWSLLSLSLRPIRLCLL